jgi:eukaryotic-like serine/threonine-protein kinase
MGLTPGTRLDPYEILAPIGAGGMGEVYRAHDTKLNRDVAIKILPAAFTDDPDRLARFTREAQTLAALNHPNIAAIYGFEDSGPTHALVMELVDGEDLSDLIARAPLPLSDALPIARQIADALEAAHEAGIVHRDLKPANVKLKGAWGPTPARLADGRLAPTRSASDVAGCTVKVLDFGLAKAMTPAGTSSTDATNSPTLTARATQMGMILGTAAYMAPEQAKGKDVDKRADIWAFGVVLYEMLTGRRAFEGEDVSTTLAAVLMRDPDWSALPADLPPALRRLIHRCLERDPRMRLRDIGEARLILADPDAMRAGPEPAAAAGTATRPSRMPWLIAATAVLAALVFAGLWLARAPSPPAEGEHLEASLAPPPGSTLGASVALSPDGTQLVMEAVSRETGTTSLWERDLATGAFTKLAGTEGGTWPFWSPSGAQIGFFADGKLKTTDLGGSPPQVICDAPSPRGGTWGPDGTIVFAGSFRTGLENVSAAGGTPVALTTLDATRHEKSHRWPVFLPDGRHLLFLAQTGEATSAGETGSIDALALDTGARTRLVTVNSSPLYSPQGFLLFWREGALRAQAFDATRLAVSGPVFSVAPGVPFDTNEHALASVSAGGTLVYSTAGAALPSQLLVVDRAGRTVKTLADSALIEGGLALSHDGTRLAAGVASAGAPDIDMWIYDLARNTAARLTFDPGNDRLPVWSADDTQLIYANDRANDGIIFERSANGQGQSRQIASNVSGMWPFGWSKDGRWLVVGIVADATSFDLMRYDLAERRMSPLIQTPSMEDAATLSSDDRWLAYTSDAAGRSEVYLRRLGTDAGQWQISTQGGGQPRWRTDGRELYYVTPQHQLMAVPVGPAGPSTTPRELFRADFGDPTAGFATNAPAFAPAPDGQTFVIDVFKERSLPLLTLVTHWTAGVRHP